VLKLGYSVDTLYYNISRVIRWCKSRKGCCSATERVAIYYYIHIRVVRRGPRTGAVRFYTHIRSPSCPPLTPSAISAPIIVYIGIPRVVIYIHTYLYLYIRILHRYMIIYYIKCPSYLLYHLRVFFDSFCVSFARV